MKNLLKIVFALTLILPVCAHAANMVSVNFFAQPESKGWGHDTEVITKKENVGISGSGLKTRTTSWNNLEGAKGPATASDLLDDKGEPTGVSVNYRGAYSTWNGAHNNKPNKAGVPAWLGVNVRNAVVLKDVHSFAKKYDVVIYLGIPEDGPFVGGEVTIGDEVQAIGPETEVLIFKDLRKNNLQIGLKNDTPAGVKNGVVVLGGLQIVAAD
jgi:hypothetical protein